ncbi:MAG: LysR family transcriptional regulator [Lachnospiraceae bacterium]|nr:LysR family transcriptional regulator [Lachnospiraceae bacterium]
MTLLSYEIFQTILEQGSFAKAAQILHLTPSAISHSISSMEEEIGFPLFIRSKNGVRLSSAGEEINPYIQKIVASEDALKQAIAQMKGLGTGHVNIGCINSVCLAWIPDIIRGFGEKHPQITVEIYQGSYSDVIEWVRNGTIDLGIVSEAASDGLPFTELMEDDLVAVVPKGYMPASTKSITPEDLKDQPFVIQQDSCDIDIIKYLDEYNLQIRANCHILDDQSAIAMVEAQTGILLMPRLGLINPPKDVAIYPLYPRHYRKLGIITLSDDFMSPAATEMSEYIKKYVADYSAKNGLSV